LHDALPEDFFIGIMKIGRISLLGFYFLFLMKPAGGKSGYGLRRWYNQSIEGIGVDTMKHRVLSVTLVFLLLILLAAPASVTAAGFDDYYKQYTKLQKAVALAVGSPNAANKMVKVQIDPNNPNVMPLIMENRTLVPLRFIATAFNAQVNWNPDTAGISIRYLDTKIEMTLNNPAIRINGEERTLEVAPISIEGRTLVPLRAVSAYCDQRTGEYFRFSGGWRVY
jgi:hypothetical protein